MKTKLLIIFLTNQRYKNISIIVKKSNKYEHKAKKKYLLKRTTILSIQIKTDSKYCFIMNENDQLFHHFGFFS